MRRALLTIAILAAAACSDDSDPAADWMAGFDGLDRTEEHGGAPVGIDDDDRVIYAEDCDLADRLTVEGAPFGPSGDETGYAFICRD